MRRKTRRDMLAMEMMKKSWVVLEDKTIRNRRAFQQRTVVEDGGEKQLITWISHLGAVAPGSGTDRQMI